MKKRIGILLMILCMCIGGQSVVYAGAYDDCSYVETHGQHNPHASNFECKVYVFPDYTIGQLVHIQYWVCKGCGYCCCNYGEPFGDLITYDLGNPVEEQK